MDGMYPDDLNKKSEPVVVPKPDDPLMATERPPEDADLYLPPSQRKKPTWRKAVGNTLKILAIVIVIAALAGGAYWQFFRHKAGPVQQQKTPTHTLATSDAYTDKTKDITSENVGLTLSYPETWSANDATDKLTITSPVTSLTDMSGQAIDGKIVLTVQPKGTMPKAFDSGGVISTLDSQKIAYTKPSPVQRGQTYLSFLQFTQELAKAELGGIYVTGDFGYQAAQFVPKTDIAKLDPLISVTFLKCDDTACKNPSDTNLQAEIWTNDADFQKTILAMLKSIQVQ
jgi:hypothetical protein